MKTLLAVLVILGFSAHASNTGPNCQGMQSGNLHTAPVNIVKAAGKAPLVRTSSIKSDGVR